MIDATGAYGKDVSAARRLRYPQWSASGTGWTLTSHQQLAGVGIRESCLPPLGDAAAHNDVPWRQLRDDHKEHIKREGCDIHVMFDVLTANGSAIKEIEIR